MQILSSIPDSKLLVQLLELSIDLIAIIDEDNKFTVLSKSVTSILGYEVDEMIGKKFTDFVHPEDHNVTNNTTKQIAAGSAVTNFENRCIHKDGSVVHLQWSFSYDKRSENYFSIARDISLQKESRKEEYLQNQINGALINSTNN
jgi:PAS domain S-box-containing protein